MLTEDDKNRIREEEIFRQEVRRTLEEEKSHLSNRQRLWEVINKPFVLWALSTIIVGLISWTYASYKAENKQLTERKGTINKIDAEIRNRIDASLKYVARLQQDHQFILPEEVFEGALLNLDRSKGDYASNLYPEYKDKSFQSLVTDLKGLVSADERLDLDKALKAFDKLKNNSMESSNINTNRSKPYTSEELKVSSRAIERAKQLINEGIMILRWKDMRE